MRDIKRSIAKATMRDAGIDKLFKRYYQAGSGRKGTSKFARNWREVLAKVLENDEKTRGKTRRRRRAS